MQAYRGTGILMGLNKHADPMTVATDYCDTVNANIDAFLGNKSNVQRISLEDARNAFPRFCSWIDAKVDMPAALSEFNIRHNVTVSLRHDA
jgi:hypothetical protein